MGANRVIYEGGVQGVGFRFQVKQIARGYDVTGWVRNLTDGRVELHAEGAPDEVDAFLEGVRQSELASHIRDEKRSPCSSERLPGFEVRDTL